MLCSCFYIQLQCAFLPDIHSLQHFLESRTALFVDCCVCLFVCCMSYVQCVLCIAWFASSCSELQWSCCNNLEQVLCQFDVDEWASEKAQPRVLISLMKMGKLLYIWSQVTSSNQKYIVPFHNIELKVIHVLVSPKNFLIHKNWKKTLWSIRRQTICRVSLPGENTLFQQSASWQLKCRVCRRADVAAYFWKPFLADSLDGARCRKCNV